MQVCSNKKIRLLNANEIECRIGTINKKGISILLYKDARVDMKILDETFGLYGWQRKHTLIDGCLYCTISVKDPETGEWISKEDVGVESYTEKEKGRASDAFKRSGFNWGIGRELYTAPWIWIPASKVEIKENNGKLVCYDRLKVTSITYDENDSIDSLTIVGENGEVVYQMDKRPKAGKTEKTDDLTEVADVVSEDISPKEASNHVIVTPCDYTGKMIGQVYKDGHEKFLVQMENGKVKVHPSDTPFVIAFMKGIREYRKANA